MSHGHDVNDEWSNDEVGETACYAGLLCPECQIVLDGSAHRTDCTLAGADDQPTSTSLC